MSKEEKRKILLKAASDVLMEYGAHKTTLDDIAKRAGMAKTSLYYYFRDKDEIIKAIIQSYMEHLLELMTEAAGKAETAEDKMFAVIEARFRFITEKARSASKEVIQEFRSLEGVFEAEKERYLLAHKDIVKGILEEGIRKGEIKPIEDLDLISLIMISSMFGCDRTFAFYDQRESLLTALKQMGRIFFTGLKNGA